MLRLSFVLALTLAVATPARAQQLVAPTGPLTPAEQQKKFHLPPGFEIQLVASEPDVNKPMNLKFDNRGRLWVTHSLEYPFAAKDSEKARDAITIFSELDAVGRAKRTERFVEHLNIPIGNLPVGENSVIAWSIPNIYRYTDTDGDGKSDQRTVVLGPFGIADTHGNQNAFTRWLDGWIYACHGFSNHSQVKLRGDGAVVLDMQSGNNYRFRPDGSAVEQVSWGQVNPFGLCFDPLGNIFTADCHSRPVTMLLRGGYYQSFGKPHDGLGFAPELTDKDHGGTGMCGVVYYAAEQFPPAFRDVLFVGNVITNRVHYDRLAWTGSSPVVEKVEDFLTCDDPWFRPVDIQLGPDGALYVADFYNKIIGHYEVPLTHPERDRERGRIWRVVYKGPDGAPVTDPKPLPDLNKAPAEELRGLLSHTNLMVRTYATNALIDRFGKEALGGEKPQTTPDERVHRLWVVARTTGLTPAIAEKSAQDDARIVRVHLAHVLGEVAQWESWHFERAQQLASDHDAFVRRAAVTALAKHPAVENIPVILKVQRETPPGDVQLAHAAKIALRDQLRSASVTTGLANLKLSPEQYQQVLQIAALSPDGPAAMLIYEAALAGQVDDALLAKALPAAVKYVDAPRIDALLGMIDRRYKGQDAVQLALLKAMHEGLAQRGIAPSNGLRDRLTTLLRTTLTGNADAVWSNHPLPGGPATASPWVSQPRTYRDGQNSIPMISSLPAAGGAAERLTGVLRSPKFTLPKELSFWMCGHNGELTRADARRNHVRLVLDDGTEVARSYPPRNDVAQPFRWDLSAHAGKTGYVEIVDALVADAYAWLAVSRFEPTVIRIPSGPVGDYQASRAELLRLTAQLRLEALGPEVTAIAADVKTANLLRLAACDALVTLRPDAAPRPLAALLADAQATSVERQQAADILGRLDSATAREALTQQLRVAPQPVAVAIAAALASRKEGATALLADIRQGKASATLLREPTVVAKLKASSLAELDKQLAELTARLAPADDRIAALVNARKEKFLAGKFDVEAGRAVFAKSACAQCHRVGQTGATLAPALDGIGVRGLDRLLEDLLDPNRNVDQAFRVTIVQTAGGQTYSGFGVREEGKTLVMHDAQGKQVRVPLEEIEERSLSTLSPMPANLGEQVSEQDFYPLLSFLLSQKVKP